ncbi:MAG: NUDIX domain-containing protein [Alphaproteobacteria bacterium]|nr:NUDIX domain-containing protein [Alphaproteobacteria bacterium]
MKLVLGRSDVEILERTPVYKGFFRINAYRLRHKLHQGGWGPEIGREMFERGHAVAVLLYDPERDALVLIDQFRLGAYVAGWTPWLVEVVAGIIEEGESPEDVARRESLEEAGCVVTDLVLAHTYLVSPGGASESVSVYCGRIDAEGVGGIHGLVEEGEDIRVVLVPAAEALAMLDSGELVNSAVLIAMQWFALNREKVRARGLGTAG